MAKVEHETEALEWDTPLFRQARTQNESALAFDDVPQRGSSSVLLETPCDALVLAAREDQLTGVNAGNQCSSTCSRTRGGVTVSCFEWVQDLSRLFWVRDEIRHRLAEKLADALRDAALVAGTREVAGALEARGMYP